MSLPQNIAADLAGRVGFSSALPQTVTWSTPAGAELEVDFHAVDTLGCTFRELRAKLPALRRLSFPALQDWAQLLCRRVTYLLEQLGPLEADVIAQTVLIRSNPPTHLPNKTAYYEVLVQSPEFVSLKRYRNEAGQRETIDIAVTHELLQKLAQDLVDLADAPESATAKE